MGILDGGKPARPRDPRSHCRDGDDLARSVIRPLHPEHGPHHRQQPRGIAVGEFNGDSTRTLPSGADADDTISLFTGTGASSATFSVVGTVPAGTDPGAIVAGQLDAGTDSDLAVVNETGDTFSVLFGTGASAATFNAPIPHSLGTGANPRGIAVGEFNGDGDPDLAVGNIGSDEVKVVIGATGVNFNPFATITTGSLDPTFLTAADVDGNGLTELAVGHASSNIITLHTSTGSSFGAPASSPRARRSAGRGVAGRRR